MIIWRDDDGSREWESLKAENGYRWYLDCYLDQMKQASDAAGIRLLDVLDVHYYSESARVGAQDRVQSVRTLYEKGFRENSWIGQWCQDNLPLLPTIQASIDRYFPGTKLAITEYNYGGEDVSATIAMTEALGCYADAGVYLATLWGGNGYQFAGINLYTDYDRKGAGFGDLLLPARTDDVSLCSAYAALSSGQAGKLTVAITNKSEDQPLEAVLAPERRGRGVSKYRRVRGLRRQQQGSPAGERRGRYGRRGAGHAAGVLCGDGRADGRALTSAATRQDKKSREGVRR